MSQNLTAKLAPFLDPHGVLRLLDFLIQNEIFAKEDVLKSKLSVVKKTNLLDLQKETYNALQLTPSEDLEKQQSSVADSLKDLESKCDTLLTWIKENPEEIERLQNEKKYSAALLAESHKINDEQVKGLAKLAKAQYESGDYTNAASNLSHFLRLRASEDLTNEILSAAWGKLSSDILMGNWDDAVSDINSLKEMIDSGKIGTPLEQLQQRTWLLHWSLFVYFNTQNGTAKFTDLCFQPTYLNAIQMVAPHLLRYITVSVIANIGERRTSEIKELVQVLQQEQNKYEDPITNFFTCLYVSFDFDKAQEQLQACKEVIANDFFLHNKQEDFTESARLFIFETYCRIHQQIDIQMLSEKLSMDKEQAELWIVNLIRNAKLDAKIDLENGKVVMSTKSPSVYEQVLEKTKNLHFQSNQLATVLLQE